MGRKLRSPTRTISNRGERPRFIGQYPCSKGPASPQPFDSLSALLCGIYLEWRTDVAHIAYEARKYQFEASDDLPALTFIPDYEVILDTGEVELYEAKYAADSLRDAERVKLELTVAHCRHQDIPYHVIYRDVLEQEGFIDTIQLLRRYRRLRYSAETLAEAENRLSGYAGAPLETWLKRAREARVQTGVLYFLLYHQRLPLTYRPLLPVELMPCRA